MSSEGKALIHSLHTDLDELNRIKLLEMTNKTMLSLEFTVFCYHNDLAEVYKYIFRYMCWSRIWCHECYKFEALESRNELHFRP